MEQEEPLSKPADSIETMVAQTPPGEEPQVEEGQEETTPVKPPITLAPWTEALSQPRADIPRNQPVSKAAKALFIPRPTVETMSPRTPVLPRPVVPSQLTLRLPQPAPRLQLPARSQQTWASQPQPGASWRIQSTQMTPMAVDSQQSVLAGWTSGAFSEQLLNGTLP
jgi:hypothetical protein